ncbi:MAG TPA: hypothetical protein VE968_09255 [Sphingomicrobium sp.]|nr:hypothetical protein [Sphingomicrobium sp.]
MRAKHQTDVKSLKETKPKDLASVGRQTDGFAAESRPSGAPGKSHDQPTPEEFGERGMGFAAKE